MDRLNIRKIEIIVLDLLSEFEREGSKLQSEYDDNASRIIEIEENIHNYKENEDIDFQVFSPRKIDNQSEEKINELNNEKTNIESINKSLYRQLKYYNEKTDKLKEILDVIEEDRAYNINSEGEVKNEMDNDITKVDEKILEYYDSIANDDVEEVYPDEPENIGVEVRSGWRIIKEELNNPIVTSELNNNKDVLSELSVISERLEKESKAIDEGYLRTREELNTVLQDINTILKNLK